jgi:hypothetical protein
MTGKKQSFRDILRNSFPVDMDGLLGEQKEPLPLQEPLTSSQIPVAQDLVTTIDTPLPERTVPCRDTAPCEGTVPSGDTVNLNDTDESFHQENSGANFDEETMDFMPPPATVPRVGTVPPPATVPLQGTVPYRATVPSDDTVQFIQNDLDGTRVELTSNYFFMDADVFDVLSFEQDAYERLIYGYLYRHSYGLNRQTCFVGLKSLVETSQLSKNSVRRALDRLEQKGHIKVVERINDRNAKGTVYRVFLPCEIPRLESHTTFRKID